MYGFGLRIARFSQVNDYHPFWIAGSILRYVFGTEVGCMTSECGTKGTALAKCGLGIVKSAVVGLVVLCSCVIIVQEDNLATKV